MLNKYIAPLFLVFISVTSLTLAQPDDSLNELLSVCKKAKTETEDNGRFVQLLIDKKDTRYVESMQLYNAARSSFEEWIEYYTLETEDLITKKDKVVNEQNIRNKINKAMDAVGAFNKYVQQITTSQNNTTVARGYIPTVTEVNTCFNSAVGFLKLIKDSKREKQETMKKDLYNRLSRYHITEFTSLK
ncbi:MAG: hypothetical protein IPJ79_18180 [Bacteroidetes bacterium]|nr:hypothetical protein [Bacteroidota bacterium]HNR18996.1 hypothetical protein [Bacteroidia bacterium]HNU32347.1 hypothetical protein [Bacteroidia bacterium]